MTSHCEIVIAPVSHPATIAARDDLEWFFRWGDGAMGLRGSGFDSDGGSRVFDDAASHRLHMRMRDITYRNGVQRRQRVAVALCALGIDHRHDLTSAYTPYGAARASWQAQRALSVQSRPLLGLVLRTRALRAALCGRYATTVEPTTDMLLRFIEHESNGGTSCPRALQGALDEANARETAGMEAYVAQRRADRDAELAMRRAALEGLT